ncbi:hypothetical protein DO64_3492 [Burkholderia pseudomallei]|nr:hypothetical protein DO64_3492 [Burkholderia pseudomallei]
MLISKIAVYVGGMGGISGCRLCAGACAAMNVSPTSVRFFLFMRFATASCGHEAADLACRAIRVGARANGEVTAHCACTLRACSNRTACTSAGHRTCAAHANAPFQRRSPRRRPAMNGESSHACRAPRRCFRSDYAAYTGRSRRAAARGTFAHMRCAPTRNAAHSRKRAVRRSCALALLRSCALALLCSCALVLLRSCAFTSSPAARFARRRPAFGESAQPAFVGPPI